MTTNTEPQLKKDLEEALEASPETDKKIKISLSEEEGIDVICEVKPDKLPDKGKTVVAYTAYQEGKDEPFKVTLQALMATFEPSILLPEGLGNKAISFKNLMVIYRKEGKESKGQWLFVLDLDIATKIKLGSLPVVGDLIANELAEEEIVPSLRIVVASKAFTIKEIRLF